MGVPIAYESLYRFPSLFYAYPCPCSSFAVFDASPLFALYLFPVFKSFDDLIFSLRVHLTRFGGLCQAFFLLNLQY
jgi:hypothetical protein